MTHAQGWLLPVRADVATLYVAADGPYPTLVREWFDETRDARNYTGPWPVVAHPPCGPWGRLRFLCTKQDAACGPHGVAMVRRWGGVLEHPQDSRLFAACSMPRPGCDADAFGGCTYALRQVSWGHTCAKPTWLYTVRVPTALVARGMRVGGVATRRVTSGPRGPQLRSATQRARTLSPLAFAEWLVSLAAAARVA